MFLLLFTIAVKFGTCMCTPFGTGSYVQCPLAFRQLCKTYSTKILYASNLWTNIITISSVKLTSTKDTRPERTQHVRTRHWNVSVMSHIPDSLTRRQKRYFYLENWLCVSTRLSRRMGNLTSQLPTMFWILKSRKRACNTNKMIWTFNESKESKYGDCYTNIMLLHAYSVW